MDCHYAAHSVRERREGEREKRGGGGIMVDGPRGAV
jgi:hypothetical protein